MATKIRLARGGSKKRPFYRIVVADVRAPRDGRFIEKLGTYNPLLAKDNPERITMNKERMQHWLDEGAQPTDRVLRFLDAEGMMKRKARNNPNKAKPGAKAQERVAEKEQKVEDAKAAAIEAEEAAKAAKVEAAEAAKTAAEAPAEEAPAEDAPTEEATPEEAPTEEKTEEAPAAEATPFVDAIVLLDGVGDKTTEALAAEGVTTLTQILDMSDEDLAALSEKVGAGDQWQSKEWKVQAQEMKDGKPPRAKVDQDLATKMAAEA